LTQLPDRLHWAFIKNTDQFNLAEMVRMDRQWVVQWAYFGWQRCTGECCGLLNRAWPQQLGLI